MVAADHLVVPRYQGIFHHHGIDLGDGTVAHYLEGREILKSPFEDFSRGLQCTTIQHEKSLDKKTTLNRAQSRIGEQNYNLLFNNCEHFANWCKIGHHRSNQLERLVQLSNVSLLGLGSLLSNSSISRLIVILRKEVLDQKSKEVAQNLFCKIEKITRNLELELNSNLKKTRIYYEENLSHSKGNINTFRQNKIITRSQTIADQISSLEDIKQRISLLVKHSDGKSE